MAEKIDWDQFQSPFFRVAPGDEHKVVLTNWRQEHRTFGEQTQNPRLALVFDVIRVDGTEHTVKPLEWCTTSPGLAQEFKPMIVKAEAKKKDAIYCVMKRDANKRYSVFDLSGVLDER